MCVCVWAFLHVPFHICSQENLRQYVDRIFNVITTSGVRCPTVMCDIFFSLRESAATRFQGNRVHTSCDLELAVSPRRQIGSAVSRTAGVWSRLVSTSSRHSETDHHRGVGRSLFLWSLCIPRHVLVCFQLLLTAPSVLKKIGGRLEFEFAWCHLLDTEAHRSDVRHKQESTTATLLGITSFLTSLCLSYKAEEKH